MPAPVPLSVVVITRNEEDRLAACLESVRWAAELVIVDDLSTDRTVEIARQYTDRVISRRMEIEGVHRNYAYGLATQEWILSLDADERVTPELREEITALLVSNPPLHGYTIPRRNYLGARWLQHGGFYPSAQLRLFRRGHFRYEEVEVHPRAFLDSETGPLRHDLIHYSYRDLHDFVAKLNRQTTLEAAKWRKDGRRMSTVKGLWRTVDRFYRTYVGKEGRKDGLLGFIMAVLGGAYQFLSYAKYWARSWELGAGSRIQPPTPAPQSLARPSPQPLAPSRRETMTAVILTKNEARQIRRCLDALRWVDEIVVVDGESTDGTPDICREYGATVITHPFGGDFGEERNLGNAHATSDWILQLDADDVVTEAFRQTAERMLRDGSPHAAYRFRRTNCFLGRWMRHGGWDHYSLHLFRRGKARYQGRVHHDLLVDGTIGTWRVPIEHYPFTSLEQFVDRQNRYTTLEAQELYDLRGPASDQELRTQLMIRPAKLFWKIYVKKQAFRDGRHGLLFAGLFSVVHFLKWAKYWELTDRHARREQPVVFLDRDGVINASPEHGYVRAWSEFAFLPGSLQAIRDLHRAGFPLVVVSNQSGVAQGFYTPQALEEITTRMLAQIRDQGGDLDAVLYCTHGAAEGCACRKPQRGLIDQAGRRLAVDLARSYVVGDDAKDVALGQAVGCRTILVLSGRTPAEAVPALPAPPDHVCGSLREAASWILAQPRRPSS